MGMVVIIKYRMTHATRPNTNMIDEFIVWMVVVVIIEQHMAYAKTQYQYVKLSTGAMVGVLYGGHGQGRQITPYDIAKTQYQYVKLSTGAMVGV